MLTFIFLLDSDFCSDAAEDKFELSAFIDKPGYFNVGWINSLK